MAGSLAALSSGGRQPQSQPSRTAVPAERPAHGPIELLILQGSPFCNIDCRYCYLPNREQRDRMSDAVLALAFRRLFESRMFSGRATIVWHAGEPLALPVEFYRNAWQIMRRHTPPRARVNWNFQTNAMLITDAWIDLFKETNASIGVSIDGPALLHDEQRVTRSGKGTLATAMRGVDQLRAQGLPFSCIAVLTQRALEYPDELYEFFRGLGCHQIGFNIDEQDGVRATTSYAGESEQAYRRFMMRFWQLCMRDGVSPSWVREFRRAVYVMSRAISGVSSDVPLQQEAHPFAIVSVDWQGNFATFSPELLGARSDAYGDVSLGNLRDTSFDQAADLDVLRRVETDIHKGVVKCRQTCDYFDVCGGGTPGNKIGENGTPDSTSTAYCRMNYQELTDAVLGSLERSPLVQMSRPTAGAR